MIGPSGKPNRPPTETTKARNTRSGESDHTFGRERLALRALFAARIAAAYLYASKHEVAAIVAALRAEERAMVAALRRQRKARSKTNTWKQAASAVTRNRKQPRPRRSRRPVGPNAAWTQLKKD
jgi:hypothetical protein